ncbi:MAG: TonB-dependent receptor [Candidatus Omnitrophota bacterium]
MFNSNNGLRVTWLIILSVMIIVVPAQAETEVYDLDPVFVRPALLDSAYDDSFLRTEYIVNPEREYEQALTEVIQNNSLIDMQRRGSFGTQADVQIRGGSFEQTDVLIDGVKVNDPQTGHFNMDIPLFISDIDRVVIVSGSAASAYGAGRQGGSIHIVTKRPEEKAIKAQAIFGANSFSSQSVSSSYALGEANFRSSLGRASSGGYRHNTGFESLQFSQSAFWKSGYGDVDFTLGVLDKEFGANGFYSEFFPEQFEQTKTLFSSMGIKSQAGDLQFNPKVYVRRHKDRFLLDQTRPNWYENRHTSYVTGAKIDCLRDLSKGKLFFGTDTAQESIKSTNLGKQKRLKNTVYSEYSLSQDRVIFAIGLTGCFYEDYKDYVSPDISAGYWLNDDFKARASFNRSFRVPTFTELYYVSPANMGNANLVPERSSNYEAGIDYIRHDFSSSVTAFTRRGKNLIDWVRAPAATVYQIQNVADVDTEGIEVKLTVYPEKKNSCLPGCQELFFGYSYLDKQRKENGLVSKYVFDYLKHKFVLGTEVKLPADMTAGLNLNYLQRIYQAGDFVLNAKLSKKFEEYNVFLKADNILNHGYSERSNIPMPGRWLFLGVETQW